MLVINPDPARSRPQQAEHQPDERTLSDAGLPYDGRLAAGLEIETEVLQDIGFSIWIAETQAFDTDAGDSGQPDGIAPFLFLRIFQFHEPVDGSRGIDEARDLAGQADERTLDLADQLEEGGHHTIGRGPVPDAESAPNERRSIARVEGDAHDGPGDDIEPGPAQNLVIFRLLQVVEPSFGHALPFHGLDDGLVLQAFLDVALDPAFALADVPGQFAHFAEEYLAEEHEDRHDQDQDQRQPPVHEAHEHDGGNKLDDRGQEGGKFLANDPRDGIDIREKTVQRIAGMHLFLALPLGL